VMVGHDRTSLIVMPALDASNDKGRDTTRDEGNSRIA